MVGVTRCPSTNLRLLGAQTDFRYTMIRLLVRFGEIFGQEGLPNLQQSTSLADDSIHCQSDRDMTQRPNENS